MPVPHWVGFDPDSAELREDFEAAQKEADTRGLPEGGSDAARADGCDERVAHG